MMDADTRKKIEALGKACGEAHLSRAFVAGAEAMEAILREREAKLVAALEFYADENSWIEDSYGMGRSSIELDDREFITEECQVRKGGRLARKALAEHHAAKGEG